MRTTADLHMAMVNAPRQATAEATLAALSEVANRTSEGGQPLALVAAAVIYLEEKGIDLQDALTAAKNLMYSHDSHLGTDFEAIRLFVRNET